MFVKEHQHGLKQIKQGEEETKDAGDSRCCKLKSLETKGNILGSKALYSDM